jgi:peptidyl-prolyl cis-trans isomerase C
MKQFLKCLIILIACSFHTLFAAQTDEETNPVLARVNGVDIYMNEVKHFIQQQNKQVTPQQALVEMINVELLSQAAKNEGMLKDEALALEIKRNTSGIIASHYLNNFLDKLEISDEELHNRYKQEYQDGTQDLEYNANHILLKTQAEARDIIKQLDKGADFSELAKTKSTGPSGKNGGALGWFKKADMVPPFSEAAASLTPGKYSKDPVQTQFGWHVILLNKTRKIEPPSFESVREQLSTTIAAENIRNMVKALHEKATIEFNPKN